MSTMISTLQTFIIIYIVLTACFFFLSDFLLYQPPRASKETLPYELMIPNSNQQIGALYIPNPQAKYTLLFSHGNAEDITTLYPFLLLLKQQGFSVMAYDYPGYGKSEGKPSEKALYSTIDAVYQYLTDDLKTPSNKIIIFGRSIGSGPSIELARKKECAGLILETPFVSTYRVYTQLPVFLFDKFQNLDKISQVHTPLLLIHGTHDSVIPIWHSKKIFAKANQPKYSFWPENADHNNIVQIADQQYWQKIEQFVSTLQ